MELKKYLISLTPSDRALFAARCRTSLGHLRNIAMYGKVCGEDLAITIDMESQGAVTCEELRPDLAKQWGYLRSTKNSNTTDGLPSRQEAA